MIQRPDISIKVCAGLGGIMSGSNKVITAFKRCIEGKNLNAGVKTKVHKVGCLGLCARDVLVDIYIHDVKFTYQHVRPEMVNDIVEKHLIAGKPIEEWLTDDSYEDFHRPQTKILLKSLGHIDPESIDAYLEIGGYAAAEKAMHMSPMEVIDTIKESGLRGRGGAGFPTGIKWESCLRSKGNVKYIVCNADEGDPGAFMDRALLEGNPHSVVEGMIIGAYAIGGTHGYVYVRAEYPLAVERLRLALVQAREKGFIGKNVFSKGFNFDIEVFLGAGAFVCGEETALITSLEDKPGEPKLKYVFPTEKGLWDRPTNINNVETWANIPTIIREGSDWYATYGTARSRGTKLFSLAGKINNTGLIEVSMGTPLRKIVYDVGGGIPDGKELKAVQMGGPSGGCIPAELMDTPVDYESIAKVGSIIGSGGMIVLDEDSCMVDMAKYFVSFCADESCGQCTPCREGLSQMVRLLKDITEGRGAEEHILHLEELSNVIIDTSFCGLGKTAPNPVLSTLRFFPDEYEAHIREKHCRAGICRAITTFYIDDTKCTGCTVCFRNCPAGAIIGEKKNPHRVNQDLCIRCRVCYEGCKFGAVQIARPLKGIR